MVSVEGKLTWKRGGQEQVGQGKKGPSPKNYGWNIGKDNNQLGHNTFKE